MGFGSDDDDEEDYFEGRRHALAQLLQARGHPEAAAIVAVSHYRADLSWVDGGDVYVVTLSVPAKLFDAVRGQLNAPITESCLDIVGGSAVDMRYHVLSPPCPDDWIDAIVRSLDRKWVPSERVNADELEVALLPRTTGDRNVRPGI